jgi:hypothetical protein
MISAVTLAWMMRAAGLWLLAAVVAAATTPANSAAGTSENNNAQANGEEFSNNLISDLGPLLALFGERYC